MNHTYRLVWSDASQRYVPVPECARGRSKSRAAKALMPAALVLGMALGLPLSALAQAGTTIGANTLPTGGSVVQGSASISQNGNAMTVQQGSGKAIINWGSFNIGKDASVQFQQHQNTDIALNRVTGSDGSDGSQILGQLTANGQVWLVNPNGIVFGQGARVDVGGLVASTLNITDQDFRDGNYRFSRNLQGSGAVGGISNQGQITARDGGSIALLAPSVSNDGVLRAQLGTVAMAAGDKVTLSAGANGLLQVEVDPSTIGTLVENKQLIVADGGQVIMTGKAADALSASVVSNTGTVQARTLQQKEGRILLLADMAHGTARIGGTLDASAPGDINSSNGGFIETSGAQVQVVDGAQVTTRAAQGSTGTWLIDPTDFSVHTGAGAQTASGIGADTLAANLANNHVTLQTDGAGSQAGDLTVDAVVTWSSNNSLTLQAHNDIKVNAAITNTGSGSFAAKAGGSFSNSGAISLAGGDISITSGAAPGTLGNTDFGGTVTARNLSVLATGDITQTGMGSLNLGTTGELRADAGGKVDLAGASNTFGVVSGSSDRGYFSVLRSGNSTAGSLTVNGITTQGGDIAVRNFAGSLSVNGAVSSSGGHIALGANDNSYSNVTLGADINAGAGSVLLWAVKNIDQTAGMMTADSLQAYSITGGAINLGQLNQVGRVGFNANRDGGTGSIVFRNGQGFAVGGMPGARRIAGLNFDLPTGITAGGDVTLSGLGGIDGDGAVSVGGTFTLEGGDWRQVGAALPSFQAKDFRLAGGSFVRALGGDGSQANPWQITDGYGLQGMGTLLNQHYALANDIDASGSKNWNGGAGWRPVGSSNNPFTGSFDGGGHVIGDLFINRPYESYVGLFGVTAAGSSLANMGLARAKVTGGSYTGALVGGSNSAISQAWASGAVSGSNAVGGLVGDSHAAIEDSYATATVSGTNLSGINIGGLVGQNWADIRRSYASGAVSSMGNQVGGLVASHFGGSLNNVYATGDVSGGSQVGGLVGAISTASISQAYATGSVTGSGSWLGGLTGYLGVGYVTNSFYATTDAGGNAINHGGGSDGAWGGNAYGMGKTLADLRKASTFAAWGQNIDDQGGTGAVWRIYEDNTTPLLRGFLKGSTVNVDVTGGLVDTVYNGQAATGRMGVSSYKSNGTLKGTLASGLNYRTNGKNAGAYSSDDGSLLLSGGLYSDQQGYDISYRVDAGPSTLTIQKKALTVGGITAGNKIYDGDTSATLAWGGSWLQGLVSGDQFSFNVSGGKFSDKNVGTGKTVSVTGTIGGADAGNYEVTFSDATANISKLAITGTISADGKTYDGSAQAVTYGRLNGVLNNDDLTVASTSGQFSDKNAGMGKTVNVSGVVSGTDAGNYDVTFNSTAKADIAKLAISGTITADGKTYDGNRNAVTYGSLNGVLSGDKLTIASTSGQFSDKNAGTGKTVTVSGVVTGADADNYEVTFNSTAKADIAKLAISGTITADGKTYDGNVQAVTHGSLNGVLTGDDLTVAATSGSFTDKNAGKGKTVNVGGMVAGADAGNYDVTFNGTTTADIAKLAINGVITADGKTYDGNVQAVTHGRLNGVLNNDDLTVASTSGQFGDKNAGMGKTVTVGGMVAGADVGNYDVTFNTSTTADITKLAISGAITADGKTYDGNVQAVTHGSLNGVLTGDDLTVAATSGSFTDKNAGTGKTVNVGGTVVGADAGNYDVTFNGTTTADIAKLAINGVITADGKTYDGDRNAVTHGGLNGVLNNDDLRIASTSGSFTDKNAGTGKTVNVGGMVAGADAGNYDVTFNTSTTADIARLAITGAITADGKTYDGNVQAVTHGRLNGVLNNDDLTVASTSGQFSDKNAGTGKTVNVAGTVTGTDAGNYDVTFNTSTTADIARLAINGVITADGKTYDGDRNAVTHGGLNGVLNNDDLRIASTSGQFSDKNAGTGKTVNVVGTVTGTDAGNYDVTFNGTAKADIAKLAINGSITVDNKTYDATTNASTHGQLNGVLAGDDLKLAASGQFGDKNAAAGKTVAVVGTVTGADAGNYDVTFNSTAQASIAKRAITGAITADNKVYDGTTVASVHASLDGVLAGDDLGFGGVSGQFREADVGVGKPVDVSGIVTGADAGNYAVSINRTTTASITSALPAPTVHAGLSGQILWRETSSSLEHEDLRFAPLAQLPGSARNAPNLTLAPGYIRLDE